MKKKRVETFRNIRYGDGRIIIIIHTAAAAVSPPVGLAQARPNYTDNAAAVDPPVGLAQARPNDRHHTVYF